VQRKREPEPKHDDAKEIAMSGMAGLTQQTAASNCVCVKPLNADERALVTKARQGGANSEEVATMNSKSRRGTIIVNRGSVARIKDWR